MNRLGAKVLAAVAGGPATVATVAERLGSDPSSVEVAAHSLADRGYLVIDLPTLALADGLEYRQEVLVRLLPPAYTAEVRQTVDSTNRVAGELLEGGHERVLVAAEVQTAGRGRRGRSWRSPPGGIWISLGDARPRPAPAGWIEGLALTLATADAVEGLGLDPRLKWPNDVTLDGSKLAGVLVGVTTAGSVRIRTIAGLGLNANVALADLPPAATSLRAHVGDVTRAPVVAAIAWSYERYRAEETRTVDAWRKRCDTIGRSVVVDTVDGRETGRATGLDEEGSLQVERDGETVAIRPERCRRLRYR
ncbi:MAG: biotin--[acetyl-CoA-carboxylase] ligase [Halobacteriota archaeon]